MIFEKKKSGRSQRGRSHSGGFGLHGSDSATGSKCVSVCVCVCCVCKCVHPDSGAEVTSAPMKDIE